MNEFAKSNCIFVSYSCKKSRFLDSRLAGVCANVPPTPMEKVKFICVVSCESVTLYPKFIIRIMAEELTIHAGSKEEKYRELVPQVKAVVEGESDLIANMANVASMLHETFGFWWTGFYRVSSPTGLVLGPFQGPLACTRIQKGKGVCGTAWERGETVIVPDVDAFPGHIACSSLSRSEIVVPVWRGGEVVAVLDIDSKDLATFDEVDRRYLEEIVQCI